MSRNEQIMTHGIGQWVLKCKNNLSLDEDNPQGHHGLMDAMTPATEFKRGFTARVKEAREDSNYTQAGIADLLGIKQDKYNKYEGRSMMPHQMIPRFCTACGVTITWLFTGRQEQARRVPRRAKIYARN